MTGLEASARRAELDWAIRNKSKLTPEQRAKYRAMWEEMNSSTPPSSSTAEVSFGPADLDPVEAAAAPIAPDPVVAPKRPAMPKPSLTDTMQAANTVASLENFDAVFRASGNHYPTAIDAFEKQLRAKEMDEAYARRAARARAEEHRSPYSRAVYADEMAATENPNELYAGYRDAPGGSPPGFSAGVAVLPDADPRTTRAERLAQSERWAADVDRRAAEYNRDTGLTPPDASVAGERGPYPGAGRPGYDRTFTNEEILAQRAGMGGSPSPAGYTAPGPRTLDGRPPRAPQPLDTPEDVEAYTTRQRDPRGPFYNPSPKDFDMGARGMMPVLNPDGTVGYSVAYPGEAPGAPGPQMTGAAGRLGLRPDLESKGWVATPADSPLGLVNVYRPGEDAQKRYDAQAEQRSRRRIAESAGLSGAEAQSMTMDALRSRASAARIDDANARREAWKAQAMLAGGQPTGGRGGSKAVTNALMMLPENERNQSLRYMLPGGDRAAAVDAANAATAGRMAQSAMSAFLTNNPGSGQLNPMQQQQLNNAQSQQQADIMQWAENHVNTNYANQQGIGNYLNRGAAALGLPVHDNTQFTVDEQDKAIKALMARYPHLTLAQATQIIDSVGATRTTAPRPKAPAGA